MKRQANFLSLVLVTVLLAMPAWADDRSDVLAANHAFDAAVSARNIDALDPLCSHDDGVMLIPPAGKVPLFGWLAVRKSWAEGTFARYSELSVTMADPSIRVNGNTAVVVGIETVRGKRTSNGEMNEFSALTTNVFEKRDGRWLMVHHHASRVPQ